MSMKIVNLGLPKSGTTTLGHALKAAGLNVGDWKIRRNQPKPHGFVGKLMYEGYYQNGDPLSLMQAFDAYTEINVLRGALNLWPQCDFGLLKAIREHHPGARFILTHREPVALADSMRRWSNLGTQRLPQNDIPGSPAGYGTEPGELERWIEGHYSFVRQCFGGAQDFLEYDIADEDAPKKIGAFLGIDLPWWGRANANLKEAAE